MKRILVAVDGSDGSNRAARFAADLAQGTGAALELLHVYDAPTAVHLGLRALSKEELGEKGEGIAHGSISAAEKAIGGRVAAEHHLTFGHPDKEIVTRAEEIDADLIVLGSRGLRDLEGILLGSVSRKVLARSKRPVTVVP
ncbi:MAG TPA: universal stress protein [Sandaracinaceae bacterium LLY-WYZ-13_1]|nr:universal stress protein [Sandaracinaceae bacterium LLY-WYZ-13_1]